MNNYFITSEANIAKKKILTDILLNVELKDILTYEDISTKSGFDVRMFSSLLSNVKTKLIRDYKIVFGTIRGIGLIRLTSEGILVRAVSRDSHLRKHSKRTIEAMACINRDELDKENQTTYDTMLKKMGFVYATLRDDTAAERLAPFVHYPSNGPEIGTVLRGIFGSQRRKLALVAQKA